MSSDDPKKIAKSALDYTKADSSNKIMKEYLERGRPLSEVADDELMLKSREAFTTWSKSIFDDEASLALNNIYAELELRGLQPPSDGLEMAIKTVTKDLASLVEGSDPEAFAPLIEAYLKAASKKQ
jgi:hypothetical protein